MTKLTDKVDFINLISLEDDSQYSLITDNIPYMVLDNGFFSINIRTNEEDFIALNKKFNSFKDIIISIKSNDKIVSFICFYMGYFTSKDSTLFKFKKRVY